ncbi:hypothetical protein Q3G72_023382 [Acer saccharum]|nr:hypothetical protein Q3G72_023382 [Acer saccharum]
MLLLHWHLLHLHLVQSPQQMGKGEKRRKTGHGLRRTKRDKGTKRDKDVDEIEMESLQFDFSTIKAATNDFPDDNKLGQGGFGAVYKV